MLLLAQIKLLGSRSFAVAFVLSEGGGHEAEGPVPAGSAAAEDTGRHGEGTGGAHAEGRLAGGPQEGQPSFCCSFGSCCRTLQEF